MAVTRSSPSGRGIFTVRCRCPGRFLCGTGDQLSPPELLAVRQEGRTEPVGKEDRAGQEKDDLLGAVGCPDLPESTARGSRV
jgi:hypothetical protein